MANEDKKTPAQNQPATSAAVDSSALEKELAETKAKLAESEKQREDAEKQLADAGDASTVAELTAALETSQEALAKAQKKLGAATPGTMTIGEPVDGKRTLVSKAVRPEHQLQQRKESWPTSKSDQGKEPPGKIRLSSYECSDPSGKLPTARVTNCCDESEAKRVFLAPLGDKARDQRVLVKRVA